jgi:putative membrane protein
VESLAAASNYAGIIFVSDGGDDEQVIPILQNIKPIVSIERVAIKHSETVEQTYMIMGRYLRMLVFDPRYSRWVLGVPGLILLLSGILIVANQTLAAELLALLIIGGAFFIRGFNLDRWIQGILSRGPYGYIRLFTTVTSALVVVVGLSGGYNQVVIQDANAVAVVTAHPSQLFVELGSMAGYFIAGSLLLVSIGVAIYASGGLLAHMVRGSSRMWRDAVAIALLVLLYYPIQTFATILTGGQRGAPLLLVSYILLGLAIIFGITAIVVPRVRTRASVAAE